MSLYVIADLHLAHSTDKPMDIFGAAWENHVERLDNNWRSTVTDDDTVVIAGDVSWGMRMEDAVADFRFLESLPGKKIILKGNHDYWWSTMKKLLEFRDSTGAHSISFLFNNAYAAEGRIICGTRGWFPADSYSEDDKKITLREAGRLRASLEAGKQLLASGEGDEILVFLHYPPAFSGQRCEPICEVLAEYGIKDVYYGHLHGYITGKLNYQTAGANLHLISADKLGFMPKKI